MGNIFYIDCSFYFYPCDRIFISLGIGHLFFKVPNSFKKFTTVLNWIPYSFCTVVLQCSVLLLLLYVAQFINLPYYSSFIIVCSTSMIIVMQAIKKWIPFLKNTNEYEIKHDSFLVDTLFLALTSNHKSILGSIILSFVFMECVFSYKWTVTIYRSIWRKFTHNCYNRLITTLYPI